MSEDTQNLPSLPDELTKEFLKEEQKQRRQELENLIARIESDQRNGLLFTGAIWGWLTTNLHVLHGLTGKSAIAIFILPTFIMGFFFYRWCAIEKTIRRIAEYTQNLEKLFKLPDNYGWEGWLVGRRKEIAAKTWWILRFVEKISGVNDPLTLAGFIFWVLLIVFNLVLGVLSYNSRL